jgi:hypothetical protein
MDQPIQQIEFFPLQKRCVPFVIFSSVFEFSVSKGGALSRGEKSLI